MNNAFPVTRSVLMEVRRLLATSEEGCWSGLSVAELIMDVDCLLRELDEGKLLNKELLGELTLPTCPLQEVAIANGWGDQYLRLIADLENELGDH